MEQFSLSEYLKNPTRPIVTRDSRSARIICTDRVGRWPIVALISDNGEEIICSFTTDGKKYAQEMEKSDLFFAPKKRTGWVNIYNQPIMTCGLIFGSEEEAKQSVNEDKTYVATVKIEWEE